MACHTNGEYLFDGCALSNPDPVQFQVAEDRAVLLCTAGLPADVTIPICKGVGPRGDDCWVQVGEVTADTPMMSFCAPGWFKLDVADVPLDTDPCVKITADDVSKEVAASIPSPFSEPLEVQFPEDTTIVVEKIDSIQYVPTGRLTEDTCEHVLARVECRNGALIEPFPLGTIDGNGDFIVALKTTPPGAPAPACEKMDVGPFVVPAGTAPAVYASILADALAATPVDYPTFGPVADTDEILAVQATPTEDGGSVLLNGIPFGSVEDPDGVNPANTIGTTDCDVAVTFCVQKCLTKAQVAAL